jgi:putative membrane protein
MKQADSDERISVGDPRVPMAAERTLLAWVRTGLAMMGFGFVVARFGLFLREIGSVRSGPAHSSGVSLWIGATLVVLGVLVNVLAAREHVRFVRGYRRREVREPSVWSLGVAVTLLLAALGVVMTAYLIKEGL